MVTLRLGLTPDWAVVSDAIGGGPVLVRDGVPVYRSNEAFTIAQLAPRGPRTAVGQRADGGIVFVTTDGRQPGFSVGMTNFELAQTLVRYGAVRGMALDGGGSSTMAFEGTVLNSPSDGKERAVSTALLLQYYGVYAPPPLETVVSPNGDGVAEEQRLSYKVVRPSTVTASLDGARRHDRLAGDGRPRARDATRSRFRRPRQARPRRGRTGASDGADRPGRGSLDPDRVRDGRSGALVVDDAPLRRQLDARVTSRLTGTHRRRDSRRARPSCAGHRSALRA